MNMYDFGYIITDLLYNDFEKKSIYIYINPYDIGDVRLSDKKIDCMDCYLIPESEDDFPDFINEIVDNYFDVRK